MKPSLAVIAYIYVKRHCVIDCESGRRVFPTCHRPAGKSEAHVTRALLACAAALLVFIPAAHATAIVAARSPTFIFIGADSKAIRGGNKADTVSLCKIEQLGKFYYAGAGLSDNPFVSYKLSKIVEEAFREGKTLTDKINRFERLVQTPLSKALEYVRRDNPRFFKDTFERGDRVALEVVFAGVVDGVPALTLRGFTIERFHPISASPTHRRNCPGDCPTGTHIYYMGWNKAMVNYAAMNPRVWDVGAVPAINKLLQIQANSTPNEVGGPIDILYITKDSAQWIQKKPECGEVNKGK